MSPSFSTKNGIRYRFYVSSALLRGRKAEVGSVRRVPAALIESAVVRAVRNYSQLDRSIDDGTMLDRHLTRVELAKNEVTLLLRQPDQDTGTSGALNKGDRGAEDLNIRLPWSSATNQQSASFNDSASMDSKEPDSKTIQTIVRALKWADALTNESYASVEELAIVANLHPKVIRNELKLAYLAPEIVEAVLSGRPDSSLADVRAVSALSWPRQVQELNRSRCSSAE
jgi:site-specific DNA recombinase